jgi:hypothetical protein
MLQGAFYSCRATPAQLATSGDHDEEDAYLLARGGDDRRHLGRNGDGCLRPVAGAGMGWRLARRGMEGWRMGTRGRGRGRRRGRDCRRDHRIPAAGLRGVPGLLPAGVRTGLLLGIRAGVRRSRPRRRLYGAAGAGLPWLCPAAATRAGLCRTATGAAARCSASAKMKPGRSGPALLGDPLENRGGQEQTSGDIASFPPWVPLAGGPAWGHKGLK